MSDQQEQSVVVVKLYSEFSNHAWIEERVKSLLASFDLTEGVDYDVVAGFVDDPKLMPDSEWASSKQVWFLNKCVSEAEQKNLRDDPMLNTCVRIAKAELKAQMTKQRASQLIDALKEQTAEQASLSALAKKSRS